MVVRPFGLLDLGGACTGLITQHQRGTWLSSRTTNRHHIDMHGYVRPPQFPPPPPHNVRSVEERNAAVGQQSSVRFREHPGPSYVEAVCIPQQYSANDSRSSQSFQDSQYLGETASFAKQLWLLDWCWRAILDKTMRQAFLLTSFHLGGKDHKFIQGMTPCGSSAWKAPVTNPATRTSIPPNHKNCWGMANEALNYNPTRVTHTLSWTTRKKRFSLNPQIRGVCFLTRVHAYHPLSEDKHPWLSGRQLTQSIQQRQHRIAMQPESLPPQGENDIAPKLCSTDEDHSDRWPMACCKVEPPEMD